MFRVSDLKNKFTPVLKKFSPAAIGVSVASFAGLAKADVAANIDTAITNGQTIVEKASGGLILIASVVAGVMLVVALLKR